MKTSGLHALSAPTLADIEALADEAFAALPATFRALCEGLVIRVEDFPDEETLEDMECETEFDLLGLFTALFEYQSRCAKRNPSRWDRLSIRLASSSPTNCSCCGFQVSLRPNRMAILAR